jgi:hypothetical protein
MSSPEHDPKQTTSTPDGALPPGGGEVINVRRGMFGVTDTGDTSRYGRLVREVTLRAAAPGRTAATSMRLQFLDDFGAVRVPSSPTFAGDPHNRW